MNPQQLQQILEKQLPEALIVVKNPLGDGMHFHALIIDDSFADQSLVQRQRNIMQPLRSSFKEDIIHALSIKTYTRSEARTRIDVVQKFGIDPNSL